MSMHVPKLRFKEFDNKWKFSPIGDVLRIKSGFGFKASEYCDFGARLLQIENVGYGKINWNKNSCLPFDYLDKYPELHLKENDIVIALNRPVTNDQLKISKLTQNDEPSILYQRVGKLCFISESAQLDYIYQVFINYVKSFVLKQAIGSDQPFISITALYKYKIPLPSLPEQTKIANFLTAIDEKITQLTQKHDLLKQYKKGVMQQIFSQKLRFKDDDGREFPEWELKKLGQVFSEVTEKVSNRNLETYSITAGRGFVSQREKFGKDISGKQNANYICLRPFQFSYNKGNSKTYFYGCVYPNLTGEDIAVPNVFISFESKLSIAMNFYAKLFEGHYLDRFLRKLISSSARMDGLLNVSKQDFFKIEIPFPVYEEQTKIANFLTAIDDKITHAHAQLEAVKQYKKGLLQQMFV